VLPLHIWEVNNKVRASLSVGKQDDECSVKGEGMCRIVVRTVSTRCTCGGGDLILLKLKKKQGLEIWDVGVCSSLF
jgi:hypothetical protein